MTKQTPKPDGTPKATSDDSSYVISAGRLTLNQMAEYKRRYDQKQEEKRKYNNSIVEKEETQ